MWTDRIRRSRYKRVRVRTAEDRARRIRIAAGSIMLLGFLIALGGIFLDRLRLIGVGIGVEALGILTVAATLFPLQRRHREHGPLR